MIWHPKIAITSTRLELAPSSLKRTVICSTQFLTSLHHFSAQNPNFDLPTSKFVAKDCLYVYAFKKAIQIITNLKSNSIPTQIINSLHFHKNSQKQLNSHYNSIIMNTHDMNQQQQHLITTITLFNHDFINSYNHNIISHQFWAKTTKFHITTIQACKFNNNNMFSIHFTYINIVSKWVHEIHPLEFIKTQFHKISTYGFK